MKKKFLPSITKQEKAVNKYNNFSIDINLNPSTKKNNKSNDKPLIFLSKKIPSKEISTKKEENISQKLTNKDSKNDSKKSEKSKMIISDASKEVLELSFNLDLEEEENFELNKKSNSVGKNTLKNYKEDNPELNMTELIQCLTCPICNGIFRNPYTINECMDTFCKRCILKFISENSKKPYCPNCKIDLNAKIREGIKYNNQLEYIINVFFPEFAAIDKADKVIFLIIFSSIVFLIFMILIKFNFIFY